ncbi:uncharacterized protein LOC116850994 [Odontomachus brunneus]|uniref:uncharacterized protein LOC116850994 n=1 Tax=Odontomachus brunneus TaxID=486640 RepID=UPI0013F1BC3D|nr:uncharacterized protein LOC116850994 [Odontomachus brunneus]
MVTKAVHIELVEDLTTESFIAALKRVIARRGKIKNIYSDNERNFVSVDRVLQQMFQETKFQEAVQQFAANERVNWHFIPPRSPHYGGIWEAAVRAMNLHFKRTIGESCLTVSEMSTILTQIEAMLNSRPLTPLSEDPDDLRALTSGHFLIGENLQSYLELSLEEVPRNTLSRWQYVEQLRQHLWSWWQKEYLSICQQRNKWKTESHAKFKVGQLVMLKDTETLPLQWILARIKEIHPGTDGVVMTVTLRTSKGIYKRAIVNISPICEN